MYSQSSVTAYLLNYQNSMKKKNYVVIVCAKIIFYTIQKSNFSHSYAPFRYMVEFFDITSKLFT